jgi:hypothetical protein
LSRTAHKTKVPSTHATPRKQPQRLRPAPRAVERAEPVARNARLRIPTPYVTAFAAAGLGTALAIVALVFAGVLPASRSAAPVPAAPRPAPAAKQQPAHEHASSAANIAIAVRQLDRLELELTAFVTARGAELKRARIVAFTDMSAMPLAHRQGPIAMRAVPGRPGFYSGRTHVPMVGDYDVSVRVAKPVEADASTRVKIGTVASGG